LSRRAGEPLFRTRRSCVGGRLVRCEPPGSVGGATCCGYRSQFLRGWGNYFRTGNASYKFNRLDRYVVWRLKRLLIKQRGRNLRAGQTRKWTPAWFHDQGLHQLMGTIRYPKAA
jgi:Group II intron, maturase-specific domain